MTTLPRNLAVQQVLIAILFIVTVLQAYLVVSSPTGLNLRGIAIIASPLASMFILLAEHPRFKQTAFRIPMIALGFALAIGSIYIFLMQRFP